MASALTGELPILWQLQISHFNEKVRWALDHKRIPHVRRSLLPGLHALQALKLTGERTTPVLTIDGRSIGDSTAIIAELEARWPQPPLYPADPEQRARALALEDYFDEELGPHVRRAIYHVLLEYPETVIPLFTHDQPAAGRALIRTTYPFMRTMMRRTMQINAETAARSQARCLAAMDRLEAELGPAGYLVGDSFTVADLTAASLLYPVVRPDAFPYPSVEEPPEEARALLDSLSDRPGGRWATEIYERHRLPPPEALVYAAAEEQTS